MDAEVALLNAEWILRRLGKKKMHFDHLPPRELRNPVEPDGCRSVCGLICNWSPLTWCNDYEKYRLKCNFSKLASKLNQWYQIYELHPLSSSDGNNQARRRLKTNAALSDRWMPAWPRLAGSGDSRPAATQAVPTGETTGESRPVAPPCALLPSIRPLISLFPPPPSFLGLPCRSLFYFSSSLHDAFPSFPPHLQSFSSFLSSFQFLFYEVAWKRSSRYKKDLTKYTCLIGFTGRSHQRCWLFVRKLLVLSVQFKREKSELLSHSVFPLCCQAEKDFIV